MYLNILISKAKQVLSRAAGNISYIDTVNLGRKKYREKCKCKCRNSSACELEFMFFIHVVQNEGSEITYDKERAFISVGTRGAQSNAVYDKNGS